MAIRIKPRKGPRADGFLDGQLLIAMPGMPDKRFARSVIYMCAHSAEGAMGLIINQAADHIEFPELLVQLDIVKAADMEDLPVELDHVTVHVGGPVETGRGFVLHSDDFFTQDSTLQIDGGISLTATIDILRAIAGGDGPERMMLALGYARWSAGQLESEIQTNTWLNCPADADLVFEPRLEQKYDRALSKIGVDPSHLVNAAGHA